MKILDKIISYKFKEIENKSRLVPLERLIESQRLYSIRDFKKNLKGPDVKIIAEIKRRSPSENDIMKGADPATIAESYYANGAAAISVLTDQHFFDGHINFIHTVKEKVSLPILRKDFIISEYQVWESFKAGADAILLIADALEYEKLSKLYNLSYELGMHVIIECHSISSLEVMFKLDPEIVGVNCRDLQTMKTDLKWLEFVYNKLSSRCLKVAESGILSSDDLAYVSKIGYDSALIGTSLMKSGSPGVALANLLNRVPV